LRNRLLSEAAHLLVLLAGAQALIALADLFWVRMQYAKRHRMSRQEQRDEHKDTEGNPLVRQRLRQLARNRARKRMMASVRRAAVVVTNPTHYAVALAYERGSRAAPRIVAKGMDEIALRIREEALAHRIPVVANPPLARALCRLELDTEIPVEHFKAVAEIVAYIWRMRPRPPL
jgi:flagellar biosynthetic protein FlhB